MSARKRAEMDGLRPREQGWSSLKPRRGELLAAAALLLVFLLTVLLFPARPQADEMGEPVTASSTLSQIPTEEEYPAQPDGEDLDDIAKGDEVEAPVMRQKSLEAIEEALRKGTAYGADAAATSVAQLGGLLFSDGRAYEAAPEYAAPADLLADMRYAKLWSLQKLHDQFFLQVPHKQYIPRLAQPISRLQFYQTFRQTSTPVIIPFEYMRHLGFVTKGWTLDEMRAKFPFTPKPGAQALQYHSKAGLNPSSELDFGPALYEISLDAKLKRGAKGTSSRNFPRNMMLRSKYLAMLDISYPPFVPRKRFQVPTLWMGTSSSDTKLHSDCCDNWVSMLQGTKKWFIAPPPEARKLAPVICSGKHQSLCWASMKYPNDENMSSRDRSIRNSLHPIELELKAGEMLYLPAGWWHHIENKGPTVMINFWTRGCENVALALDKDPLRRDRPDFTSSCARVVRYAQ